MAAIPKSPADVLVLPLEVRAQMAFEAAFEKVLDQYAKQDLPLSRGRDGKVVEISAEELRKSSDLQ